MNRALALVLVLVLFTPSAFAGPEQPACGAKRVEGKGEALKKSMEWSLWSFRSPSWNGYVDFQGNGRYWTHWGYGRWSVEGDRVAMANEYDGFKFEIRLAPAGTSWSGMRSDQTSVAGTLLCAKYVTVAADDGVEKAIVGFYRDLLGREPDAPGLKRWLGRHYDQGWSLEQIRQGFLASPEYLAKVWQQPAGDDQAAANAIAGYYRELLGREPEPEGLAHWLGQYRSGRPLDWIRARIDESPERQQRLRQQQRQQPGGR